MITPDRAAGVRLVTDREFVHPDVHPLMVDDDPIARRAVQLMADGMNAFQALDAAEREADRFMDHVAGH